MNQQDWVEYQQKMIVQKDHQGGRGVTTIGDNDLLRTVKQPEEDVKNRYAEGLCLVTLTIPLSRLPLEDGFTRNNAAIVKKWYQLEDPNLNTKQH